MKRVKKIFNSIVYGSLIEDFLFGLFGIYLVFNPVAIGVFFVRLLGILILISSLFSFIRYFIKGISSSIFRVSLVNAIIKLVLGLFIIIKPKIIADLLVIAFGIVLFVNGLIKLYYAFKFYNNKEEIWPLEGILAIGLIVMGGVLIINPFPAAVLLSRVTGVFALCFAIFDGIQWLLFKKRYNELLKIFN
ncbi:MAG: HdeD family acid-resistance protein [Bacilli bacterium]